MRLPSLADIFSELVQDEDTGAVAGRFIEAMKAAG
jgi:hypothetical protein